MVSGVGCSVGGGSAKREPQNTACDEPFDPELTTEGLSRVEQGISNAEVFVSFDIRYSLFDIRYLNSSVTNEWLK
jgi:hypothetical protein